MIAAPEAHRAGRCPRSQAQLISSAFLYCCNDVRWQAYFEQTLATIKPSVGREDLKMYEDFTRMFGMEGTTTGLEEEEEEQDDEEVVIVSASDKGKEKLVEMEVDAPPASSTKRRRTGGARSAAPRRPVVAV